MPFLYLSVYGGNPCSAVDYVSEDENTFLNWLNQAIKTFQKEAPKNINEILDGNTGKDLFPT